MKSFIPSKYQQAIFDLAGKIAAGVCFIINAVAGSGKTTTIVKFLELIPSVCSVLFLAFNKSIAAELDARTPKNVKGKTFNSVGGSALWFYLGKRNLNLKEDKIRIILKDILTPVEFDIYASFVFRLVGLGKNAGIGYLIPDSTDSWFGLIDHFDLMLDSDDATENRAIEIAQEALAESNKRAKTQYFIDYNDQLYLPLIWSVKFFQNDWVFVDESQDTNAVQLALLKRMVKPGGHVVMVGDKRQAIYGFRGADSSAMDNMKAEFDATELPLSICYRCAKAIVRAAQKFVPEIEYAEDAPEGKVENLLGYDADTFLPTDAIICRVNAPLVEMAYKLIAKGKGCKMLGRAIGEGLITLVKRMKAKGIDKLIIKLEEYKNKETAKFVSKGQEDKAAAVEDKIECLNVIIDHLAMNERTIPALINKIDNLFPKEEKDPETGKIKKLKVITLCSAHKSKGLEFERVFILDASKHMPSKWARKAWQKEQENNLIYVAITRAMLELYWIESDGWEKKMEPKQSKEEVYSESMDSREAFPELLEKE